MPKKQSPQPTWKKALGAAWYALFLALVFCLGAGAGWVNQSRTIRAAIFQIIWNKAPEDVFLSDGITMLVLGCDEDRAPGGKKILRENARSDMMLVARIDFKNKRIGGISIPRDLEVAVPGYVSQKINAYHSIGGKDLAKQAVEYVLGISIDKVVVLNYAAFQEMVNIVDGVDVFVEKKLDYDDDAGGLHIHLKPGRQHLDGYQAMGYVRIRHSDDDFQRIKRQREFMLALKDAMAGHLMKANQVVEKAAEVLGGDLDEDELASLGLFIRKVPSDSIKMTTLKTLPGRGYNLLLDPAALLKTLEENYLVSPSKYTSRVVGP